MLLTVINSLLRVNEGRDAPDMSAVQADPFAAALVGSNPRGDLTRHTRQAAGRCATVEVGGDHHGR
jgi:hypothetical protein